MCCGCCPVHPAPSGDGSEGGMCAGRFPASDPLDCCMMSLTCREWAGSLERDDLQTPGLVCTPRVGNFTCSLTPHLPANQNIQKNSRRGEFLLLWCMQSFGSWELGLKPAHGAGPKPLGFPFQSCPRKENKGSCAAGEEGVKGRDRGLALLRSLFAT